MDIVESTQPEAVTCESEPTFAETLQSAASFCESLKRQGSADEWDFDYLIGKFRDAAFAVSLWDKARGDWLAEITALRKRVEEAEGVLAKVNNICRQYKQHWSSPGKVMDDIRDALGRVDAATLKGGTDGR